MQTNLNRGNYALPFVINDNSTDNARAYIIKTDSDIDLTATFQYSENGTDKVTLNDAAGDAITLSIPAADGIAGIQLADIAAKNVHISIAAAAGKAAPVITDEAAANETATEADITATVNPSGSETVVLVEYGTEEGVYTESEAVAESPLALGTDDESVTLTLADLTPETTYYFRIKAYNSVGITVSDEASFTTIAE